MTFGASVSVEAAGKLLDYKGRPDSDTVSESFALEQLHGAVAVHNLLQSKGVAYVADEVGTGKTLVAAGALALLRHRQPQLRALVIAPRANLQDKWRKELTSFARHNVRFPDLRVQGIGSQPVRPPRVVDRLADVLSTWGDEPECDVLARLSSFQLGYRDDRRQEYVQSWHEALGADSLPAVAALLRQAERGRGGWDIKEVIAAAVNRALPRIDVLVVDEAHNLKGGPGSGAARNRVLWTMLGHNPAYAGVVPGYAPRADRVLMLSATPMDDQTDHLRAQLDVLGVTNRVPGLHAGDDDVRLAALNTFLFRRLTKMEVGGQQLTRNRYREEWRRGGTLSSEDPLQLDDARGRLTFALVQKRVAEALNHGGGVRSLQIGMLTSFESLASSAALSKPTTTVIAPDADADAESQTDVFDDREQNRSATDEERRGIDDDGIRKLVASHEATFGRAPAHPKMDAVVARLVDGARHGRKALVFTRRVASVDEIVQRVNDQLDLDLKDRMVTELPDLTVEVEQLWRQYRDARAQDSGGDVPVEDVTDDEELETGASSTAETLQVRGGRSLFHWLFRNREHGGLYTGGRFRQRLEEQSGAYRGLLEDNLVAATLAAQPGDVLAALGEACSLSASECSSRVDQYGSSFLGTQKEPPPFVQFRAAQHAALTLLAERAGQQAQRQAQIALASRGLAATAVHTRRSGLASRLEEPTLGTLLRADRELCSELWHPELPHSWRTEDDFARREWRWRLLTAALRFDAPAVDLWLCEIRRHGSLRDADRTSDAVGLAQALLDRLREQRNARDTGWTSYAALRTIAENADLIMQVNGLDPQSTSRPPWVGSRTPAVGMSGRINKTVVPQFRTPTYPLVLVSTDLLQEGEDLHTFCDEVHHYGMAWMPSSVEQRTGRIDRVNSLTQRRLNAAAVALTVDGRPELQSRLQVLYPFVSGTYEQVQNHRVFSRLDEHLRLMHAPFGQKASATPRFDVDEELRRDEAQPPPPLVNLGEPYPIQAKWLRGSSRFPVVDGRVAERAKSGFLTLLEARAFGEVPVTWLSGGEDELHLIGECDLGERIQPLDLRLSSTAGAPAVLIVSPVGVLSPDQLRWLVTQSIDGAARLGVIRLGPRDRRTFSVTVEDFVLTSEGSDVLAQVAPRAEAVVRLADELEREVLEADRPAAHFADDLRQDAARG